jgi:hypothetical protein
LPASIELSIVSVKACSFSSQRHWVLGRVAWLIMSAKGTMTVATPAPPPHAPAAG